MRRVLVVLMALIIAAALGQARQTSGASSAQYIRGAVEEVAQNAARVEWAAEGSVYFDRRGGDGYFDAWRMNPDGTAATCLTCNHPQLPARHVGNPEIVPGNRYLILQVEKAVHDSIAQWLPEPGIGRFNDLWALDLVTMQAYQLTNVPATGVSGVLHHHANHDGTKLFWTQVEGATGEFDDMAIAVADFVTTPAPHLENTAFYNPGPDPTWMEAHGWGPDDSWVYFACTPLAGMSDGAMDLCRMDFADPAQVTRLTDTSGLGGEPAEWDEHADLSPAGDVMAWMSSAPHGAPPGDLIQSLNTLKTELYLANADGTSPRRITHFNEPGHPDNIGSRAIVSDLEWNGDGTRILMRVQFPDTAVRDRLYAVDLCADADANAACDVHEGAYPADAITVQTDTIRPEDDLVIGSVRHLPSQPPTGTQWYPEAFGLDLATMAYHRLTWMGDVVLRHIAASPDRRKLLLERILGDSDGNGIVDELDNGEVWVVELASGKAWPLTAPGSNAGGGGVDWLDNEWVVFRYKPPGPLVEDIVKQHIRTGERVALTDTPQVIEADPGVSPDRTLVSYSRADLTDPAGSDEFGPIYKTEVWLMNADGSNERRITDGGPVVGRFGGGFAGDFDSDISPDNTRITFGRAVAVGTNDQDPNDSVPGWGTHRIYIADLTTLATTELTSNLSVAVVPDWDYDGSIYFSEVAVTSEHQASPYLGLARTSPAGGLTRIESTTPSQIWKGALIAKLIPPDSDADGTGDVGDNCPAWANASQALPPWSVPADDPDCDGFPAATEAFVGTAASLHCAATAAMNDEPGADAWPVDLNDDRRANTIDIAQYVGKLNKTSPDPLYVQRLDLNANNTVNTLDIGRFVPFLNKTCAP